MAAFRTKPTERPLRAYVDTSVFGGVHDDEFRIGSERFFRAVREGAFTILSSEPLTIARADVVVSWNFKHLVQLRRIRAFHAVNLLRGYPLVEIRSPLEVTDDEG